jgi:hypothetical protein
VFQPGIFQEGIFQEDRPSVVIGLADGSTLVVADVLDEAVAAWRDEFARLGYR